ncbi:MAG: hypothetical protein DSY34_00760 [Desulfurobacterium sp.]|nr:MAG: hypothetical protein DSY34_00760 [Desulfurobacterium sp.]
MPKRHKLDEFPEAKKRVFELHGKGKSLEEIAKEISIEYPVNVSKASIHRLIKKYRGLLKAQEVGIIEDDVDLMRHSQNLSMIAIGLAYEVAAEWREKGTITPEKIKTLFEMLSTTSNVAKTTAQIEKIKTQLIQHIEKVMEKITKAVERVIEDEETRIKLLMEIRKELEG